MADDKKTAQGSAAQKPAVAKFDPTKLLAPGQEKGMIRDVGNLTPIWSARKALETGLALAGRMDRFEIVDMGDSKKDPKDRYRPMIRIVLAHPTVGVLGSKEDQKEVNVPAGGDIFLPITGSIKAKKELLLLAWTPTKVHYLIAYPTGEMISIKGQASDMVEIATKIVDDPIDRVGRFANAPQFLYAPKLGQHGTVVAVDQAPVGLLPNGQSYDMNTGEVQERQMTA